MGEGRSLLSLDAPVIHTDDERYEILDQLATYVGGNDGYITSISAAMHESTFSASLACVSSSSFFAFA